MSAHLTTRHRAAEELVDRVGRALRTARAMVGEAACAVGGHDYLRQTAGTRLFLRCADCGHETPGWRFDPPIAGLAGPTRMAWSARRRRP